MAKKTRRARAKRQTSAETTKRLQGKHAQIPKSTVASKGSVPPVQAPPLSVQVTRYQYVLPELRRIGIIAGALLLILIVLTFILG